MLFGIPSWKNFSSLDAGYLDTLHYHFPSAIYIDYDFPPTKKFIKQYREKYFSDPEQYVYQGYDAALFYFLQLKNYGTNFSGRLAGADAKGLQTLFSFYHPAEGSGFDNNGVFILKYQGFKLVKAN